MAATSSLQLDGTLRPWWANGGYWSPTPRPPLHTAGPAAARTPCFVIITYTHKKEPRGIIYIPSCFLFFITFRAIDVQAIKLFTRNLWMSEIKVNACAGRSPEETEWGALRLPRPKLTALHLNLSSLSVCTCVNISSKVTSDCPTRKQLSRGVHNVSISQNSTVVSTRVLDNYPTQEIRCEGRCSLRAEVGLYPHTSMLSEQGI